MDFLSFDLFLYLFFKACKKCKILIELELAFCTSVCVCVSLATGTGASSLNCWITAKPAFYYIYVHCNNSAFADSFNGLVLWIKGGV